VWMGMVGKQLSVQKEWGVPYALYLDTAFYSCTGCGVRHAGGVDQIDGRRGYTTGNICPCCTECNLTKSTVHGWGSFALLASRVRSPAPSNVFECETNVDVCVRSSVST
jgi:hypothetical protein